MTFANLTFVLVLIATCCLAESIWSAGRREDGHDYITTWREAVDETYSRRLIRLNSPVDEFDATLEGLPQTKIFLQACVADRSLLDSLLSTILDDLELPPNESKPSSAFLGILYCKAIGLSPGRLLALTGGDELKINWLIVALFANRTVTREDILPGPRHLRPNFDFDGVDPFCPTAPTPAIAAPLDSRATD